MEMLLTLLSLVLLADLTTVSAKSERMYSRRLAKIEGYKLTKDQELVDAFLIVMDHITKNKRDPQWFNGDHLLNVLKEKRDVPFLRSLEQKFQPVHDASKSSVHSLATIMQLWEEIVNEAGMDIEDGKKIMTGHELFDQVSERLDSGYSHSGQTAFGKKGHMKSGTRL